jgi:hypothetical protein
MNQKENNVKGFQDDVLSLQSFPPPLLFGSCGLPFRLTPIQPFGRSAVVACGTMAKSARSLRHYPAFVAVSTTAE